MSLATTADREAMPAVTFWICVFESPSISQIRIWKLRAFSRPRTLHILCIICYPCLVAGLKYLQVMTITKISKFEFQKRLQAQASLNLPAAHNWWFGALMLFKLLLVQINELPSSVEYARKGPRHRHPPHWTVVPCVGVPAMSWGLFTIRPQDRRRRPQQCPCRPQFFGQWVIQGWWRQ